MVEELALVALDEPTARLYRRALEQQWSVDADVDWNALSLAEIAKPARLAMSRIYGHVHQMECFGLGLCGRLLDVTAAGSMRDFAALQVADEARHVDFFGRIVDRLGERAEPSIETRTFVRELSDVRELPDLLLYGQIVENAAQTLVNETSRRAQRLTRIRLRGSDSLERLARYLVVLIGRDEARHIAFGSRALAACVRELSTAQQRRLERDAALWSGLFDASIRELRPCFAALGWPVDELAEAIWRAQNRQLRRIGLEVEPPGGIGMT